MNFHLVNLDEYSSTAIVLLDLISSNALSYFEEQHGHHQVSISGLGCARDAVS